jgi:hypothetical protein
VDRGGPQWLGVFGVQDAVLTGQTQNACPRSEKIAIGLLFSSRRVGAGRQFVAVCVSADNEHVMGKVSTELR